MNATAKTPKDSSGSSPSQSPSDELSATLYQLALIMAKGRVSGDLMKQTWVRTKIDSLYTEERRKSRALIHRGVHGVLHLPKYSGYDKHNPPQNAEFLDLLDESYAQSSPLLTYTWKPLTTLPMEIESMICLREVNLGWNKLTLVPRALFQLPFLYRVFLNNNALSSLPPLSGAPLLETLTVNNNRLASLPADIHFLPLLTSLQIDHNRLRSLPSLLVECKLLSHLDASDNLVAYVPPEFSRLDSLSVLCLDRNPISNLPSDIYRKGTHIVLEELRRQYEKSGANATSSLRDDFSKFENSDLYADIAFKPRGAPTPILAHRIMIASRCPKLHSYALKLELGIMDKTQDKPKPIPSKDSAGRSIIPLNDMDPATFALLKTWIYSGTFEPKLPEIRKLVANATFEEERSQQQEIAAATRILAKVQKVCETYDLPVLKVLVEEKMGMEPVNRHSLYGRFGNSAVLYASSFRSFLNRERLADVTFVVEEGREQIKAHKFILCARSDFFRNMFDTKMSECITGEVILPDVSKAALFSILAFCYRDEAIISPDIALELLTACKRFALPKLGEMVETAVAYSLDNDNVASIYQLATLHGYRLLANACDQYIVEKYQQLKPTDFDKEHLTRLGLLAKK